MIHPLLEDHTRALWAALHLMAWQYPRDPGAEERRAAGEWLAEWAQQVPGRTSSCRCTCAAAWDAIIQICPPPLDHGPDLYWWTVAAHDRINRKLRKPLAAPDWSLSHILLLTP